MNVNHMKGEDASSQDDDEQRTSKFVEPKLTFHKPELEKQGSLETLTKQQGFFGLFPGNGS